MKKITIDCRMIEHSGAGTYLQNVIYHIVNRYNDDIFFYLIGPRNKLEKYIPMGDNHIFIDCDIPIFSIKEQLSFKKYIPNDTDLLWIPHWNIPFLYGKKIIVTLYDVLHLAQPRLVGNRVKSYISWIYFIILRFKAVKIITISEFSKKEIIKYLKVNGDKVDAILLGAGKKSKIISKCELNGEKYFLYVGNVKEHKNLKVLLKAFNNIKNMIDAKLLIVGNKEKLRSYDKKLDDITNEIGDKVIFTGYVSDEKLEEYYLNALAFVFPSKYEGFGLPILEAMERGCPVISSNAASLPEVAGEAALLFDPYNEKELADLMLKIYDNPKLREELVKRGYEQIKKFSWQKCSANTMDVLKGCL